MLTNIANDLDLLLTDLCHMHSYGPGDAAIGERTPGVREQTLHTLTQHSGDTLGRDSFLSSAEAASRRLGDTTGSDIVVVVVLLLLLSSAETASRRLADTMESVVVVVDGGVLVVVCPPLNPPTDVGHV